jgi:ribosomal protein S18 acetylase RimI-like enzyme
MLIRRARSKDQKAIWKILEPVIRAGETYTLPRDMSRQKALLFWLGSTHEVFVAEQGREILGTYFIRPNQLGAGAHVANCGYVTAAWATGQGIARAMCQHSLEHARSQGFRAMQFNFVVSTNQRALRLWLRLGFNIVGCLPGAFEHPARGFVDAYILYRDV